MNTDEEKQGVEKLVSAYAEALNAADNDLIPAFYSKDGLFMPDKMKTFSQHDLQTKKTGSHFKKMNFHIDFSVNNIVIDGRFAFAQALAKTITTDLITGGQSIKTSRDLFVLRKEPEEWKIYRYIFNNVKEVKQQ